MFSGFLLKIGDTEFPLKYMNTKTYTTTPLVRQDLESYRDANGYLHRDVLPHKPTKIEFTTPPIENKDVVEINALFRENFINEAERKLNITYYNMETDQYLSCEAYMPDTSYVINNILNGVVYYDPIRLAFIEY